MLDLTQELAGLAQAAMAHVDAGDTAARMMVFTSARTGSGTSTVAREFARLAARKAKRGVMLVDLDFFANGQLLAFSMPDMQQLYGPIGSAVSASPEGFAFWRIAPALVQPDGQAVEAGRYLTVHQVGKAPLWVTRFHHEALRRDQRIQIVHNKPYWDLMRGAADLIVIDAPPYERSRAGLTLARAADELVIVVDADMQDDPLIAQMRDDIKNRGLVCSGVIVNRAPAASRRMREAG